MRAIIFDIDGTLLQSAAVDDDLYRASVIDVLGGPQLRDSLHDYVHVSDSGILAEIFEDNGIGDDPALAAAVQSRFVNSLKDWMAANGPFREVPGAGTHCRGLPEPSLLRLA